MKILLLSSVYHLLVQVAPMSLSAAAFDLLSSFLLVVRLALVVVAI
jgi:hypothetical protein